MGTIILLLFMANQPSLYDEINAYRVANGLNPLVPDERLERSAAIQCEWYAVAQRMGIEGDQHSTLTIWLQSTYPDLLWDRLYATYGPTLPEWLNWYDRARLCGWSGGAVGENGAFSSSGKPKVPVVMAGWKRSPGHNSNLLGDWDVMGFAVKGRALYCEFGTK